MTVEYKVDRDEYVYWLNELATLWTGTIGERSGEGIMWTYSIMSMYATGA